MMDVNVISNIAMSLLVLGTLPNIAAVIRDRKNLRGFNTLGSVGIFLGQSIYLAYFLLQGDYITSALDIPLMIFWLIVIIFKTNNWGNRCANT